MTNTDFCIEQNVQPGEQNAYHGEQWIKHIVGYNYGKHLSKISILLIQYEKYIPEITSRRWFK